MRYKAVATLAAAATSSRANHLANGETPSCVKYSMTFRVGIFYSNLYVTVVKGNKEELRATHQALARISLNNIFLSTV